MMMIIYLIYPCGLVSRPFSTPPLARARSVDRGAACCASRAMATRDELRLAARQHAERGLRCSAKWVAELLVSIARDGQADAEMLTDEEEEDEDEQDRVLLAKAYFDTNEFQRAAHALQGVRGARGRFLRWYSLFLVGEKRKEEETLEEVKRQAFDEGGKPIRFGQQNAILISSLEKLETIAKNALTRFKSARHAPKPAPFPTAPIERQLLCLAGHQLRTCT